jgi:hypothetical protein
MLRGVRLARRLFHSVRCCNSSACSPRRTTRPHATHARTRRPDGSTRSSRRSAPAPVSRRRRAPTSRAARRAPRQQRAVVSAKVRASVRRRDSRWPNDLRYVGAQGARRAHCDARRRVVRASASTRAALQAQLLARGAAFSWDAQDVQQPWADFALKGHAAVAGGRVVDIDRPYLKSWARGSRCHKNEHWHIQYIYIYI